ncbi:MAG TPA: hypothetical protein VF284_04995 [Rhodanobacteraceae bacterium]
MTSPENCPWHVLAVCFQGQPGEQATMFLLNPSGNALQFKAFADRSKLFAK